MLSIFSKYRGYFPLILLGALMVVALLRPQQEDLTSAAHRLDNFITDRQNEFERVIPQIVKNSPSGPIDARLNLFVFNGHDSLVYYNSNSIYPPNDPAVNEPEVVVTKQKNGWYLQLKKKLKDGSTVVGMHILKHEYRFENKFLTNEYDLGFKIPANYNITETSIRGSVPVHDREGKILFSLYADETHPDNDINVPLALIYLLIIFIVGFYINEAALAISKMRNPLLGFLFLSILAVNIRYAMIVFKFPAEFHKLELFNPTLYGSAFFAESLGDLLLTCCVLFWLCAFYYRHDTRFSLSPISSRYRTWEKILLIVLQFVASGIVLWLFKSLVMDSVISFEVYNILSLNLYSMVGLVCVTLILICHFLLSINAFRKLIDLNVSVRFLAIGTIVVGILFTLLFTDKNYSESVLFTAVWSLFFGLIGLQVFKRSTDLRSTQNILIFILLYSILSMFLIENLYERKERNKREFLAGKLLSDHDYIAEFTFDDIAQRIATDRFVKNVFAHKVYAPKDLHDRISSLYFSGYFSKYEIKVYTYDSLGDPFFPCDSIAYKSFTSIYDSASVGKPETNLIYINDSVSNFSYVGTIPIINSTNGGTAGVLVLYLSPKIYNGQNVYPELLLGQNISSSLDNSSYNFAIYHNDRLVVQHGDFPYSYYWDKKMNTEINQPQFIETSDWEHLVCRYPNNRSLIISIPQEGFFEPVATMSYFFVIYFLIISVILTLINLFRVARSNNSIADEINMSFRARINYSMLAIIIVSFVVIGLMTISFFKTQYDGFYTDRLQRKEKAILTSIEFFIQENYENLRTDSALRMNLGEILSLELVKISDIHNIDINVYDTQGDLATSSQPSIFDNGLVSKKMDPTAYRKLHIDHETQFTQQEKIGKLNYTATYAPIRNKSGATVAFLNVPYFEKSKTINDEVSSFLVTLMNAYVFLLLCAAVLAYFISNSITRPLRFISEKLRILNLNKKNEPIEWKSKDEVGTLISEYNKMIAALESSASKLAKNERESAWREMAKQIAHEIKNPLTPMKLSIQYLQRAIDEGNPNVNELAKKVNRTLIEQIENLSSIATAFSTFAQMPKSQSEPLDINELLRGIVALFEKEDNVAITFMTYKEKAMVFADKNQMISVFNNLVKNAIQSAPEGRDCEITIITLEEYGNIKTVIMDNGSGIAKESYEKVFAPNFTTKSSGTGLGLAICKQIVENAKGQIWFESELNEGTSFYVNLPYYNPAV